MNLQTLLDAFDPYPVYLHKDEVSYLEHCAATLHDKKIRIINVGTGYGGSAILLLKATWNPAEQTSWPRIYTIDSYQGDTVSEMKVDAVHAEQAMIQAIERLIPDPGDAPLRLCIMTADSQTYEFPYPVDLVFIDGDHTFEGVKADFENWLPVVKQHRLILLHDSRRLTDEKDDTVFARGWPGPTQLAQELRQDDRVELVDEVYSITAWRKL